MKSQYILSFCAVLTLGMLLYACTDEATTFVPEPQLVMELNKPAPGFSVESLDGGSLTLDQFKGKIVLIDFWASWCGPCLREMSNLREVYQEFKDRDFVLVGLSLDRTKEAWRATVRDSSITWEQGYDGDEVSTFVSARYGVWAIPRKVLIDRNGIVVDTNVSSFSLRDRVAEEVNK